MTYFGSFHSHLQVFSKEDLKGTRIEYGFKRAFMSLFGQDNDTFTSTMLLNVDQLQKQLDKDEFQEDGSMASFWYFAAYTGIEVKQFKETLLQHMSNVKKSVAKRPRHKRLYDRRVNKRQMPKQDSKVELGKTLDAGLVVTESSGTESGKQDTRSMSGNDADVDNADIKPVYDKEPMVEVQLTAEWQHGQFSKVKSNEANIKRDIDEIKTINIELEHSVAKLLAQNEHLIKSIDNADLKAQIQEKVFAIAALKNKLRKSKGNSVDTKFAKTSVLGKPVIQPLRNQSVVRQPNAFKSERPKISKPRFPSQVDVEKD
ncbi:hypothetical protein Tco_0904001 [Tanacetum coccineum]